MIHISTFVTHKQLECMLVYSVSWLMVLCLIWKQVYEINIWNVYIFPWMIYQILFNICLTLQDNYVVFDMGGC